MSDEKGTGGPGKSRLPKSSGKLPRVSVSLPDELKDIIEKEAGRRGVTVSKYVTDILVHTHDENGINIPEPVPGQVDLSPVLNAITVLAGEVRGVKTDVQDMKNIVYALPSGSTAQRGTIQKALIRGFDEREAVPGPIFGEVGHSAAPIDKTPEPAPDIMRHSAAQPKVQHNAGEETWITGGDLKKMFHPDYTGKADIFSKILKKFRESGELVGREPSKKHWEYEADSVRAFFEKNPVYLTEKT